MNSVLQAGQRARTGRFSNGTLKFASQSGQDRISLSDVTTSCCDRSEETGSSEGDSIATSEGSSSETSSPVLVTGSGISSSGSASTPNSCRHEGQRTVPEKAAGTDSFCLHDVHETSSLSVLEAAPVVVFLFSRWSDFMDFRCSAFSFRLSFPSDPGTALVAVLGTAFFHP